MRLLPRQRILENSIRCRRQLRRRPRTQPFDLQEGPPRQGVPALCQPPMPGKQARPASTKKGVASQDAGRKGSQRPQRGRTPRLALVNRIEAGTRPLSFLHSFSRPRWLLHCRAVNLVQLFHPSPTLPMLEGNQLLARPVKVKRKEGYLLVELAEGVAYDFPDFSGSTSNPFSQCGQTTCSAAVPFPLMRL